LSQNWISEILGLEYAFVARLLPRAEVFFLSDTVYFLGFRELLFGLVCTRLYNSSNRIKAQRNIL